METPSGPNPDAATATGEGTAPDRPAATTRRKRGGKGRWKWAKRLGAGYLVFCFFKGLVWLAVGVGAYAAVRSSGPAETREADANPAPEMTTGSGDAAPGEMSQPSN